MFRFMRIAAIVLAFSSPALAGTWSVGDDGQQPIVAQSERGGNYEVTNNGPDNSVTVVKKNSQGAIVGWWNLGNGESFEVGVAFGDTLLVDDRVYEGTQTEPTITNDGNMNAAAGTWSQV